MSQLQVLVVGNEIVPRDTPCVVAARDVAELGHQLRTRCASPSPPLASLRGLLLPCSCSCACLPWLCFLVLLLGVWGCRLRLPVEVTVMGWDADFGEWAQLEQGQFAEIARQPGFKIKLTAKK